MTSSEFVVYSMSINIRELPGEEAHHRSASQKQLAAGAYQAPPLPVCPHTHIRLRIPQYSANWDKGHPLQHCQSMQGALLWLPGSFRVQTSLFMSWSTSAATGRTTLITAMTLVELLECWTCSSYPTTKGTAKHTAKNGPVQSCFASCCRIWVLCGASEGQPDV